MSKQIQQFITASINSAAVDNGVGYIRNDQKFEPVVAAVVSDVEEQGERIADAIRAEAADLNISESRVENFLIQVGLADEPEPEPTPEPVTLESLAAAQAKTDALLQDLLKVAKSYAPSHFANIG